MPVKLLLFMVLLIFFLHSGVCPHQIDYWLPQEFTSSFKQFMIYGNQSYNWLGNQQPTYSVQEIINHTQLGFSGVVKCGDEYQFNSFSLFADELH